MEEDSLAPFADLLADNTDTAQAPGRLQEFYDYGRLYEYSNAFAEFLVWDGAFESKQTGVQSPSQSFPVQTEDAEVTDRSGIISELPELSADDFADASTEICAFCLESRVLMSTCPKCKSAHYCSKEHQVAHSLTHEASCGSVAATPEEPSTDESPAHGFPNGFQFSASSSPDLAPADSELRSEMLELLGMFEAVYENKSPAGDDTRSLLKKSVAMCERIMERHYRLPQVVAMHEQATALLQVLGDTERVPDSASENSATTENGSSSGMLSVRDHLKADVQEALERVDRDLLKDSDGGEEVDGVYRREGVWYCKAHVDREQCEECGVDYRILNQVHREGAEEAAQVDDTIRKEQQRLEELDLQRTAPPHPEPSTEEFAPAQVHNSADAEEDFQSIAKDLKEELDRARAKEEADFLKCFASFQIS